MSAGGAEIDRRHPGDMERNIPHADGSRECHPMPQAGADAYVAAIEDLARARDGITGAVRIGIPEQGDPHDVRVAATFRAYVEAGRWLEEQKAALARKATDIAAAAVARERARIDYLDALTARDASRDGSGGQEAI